MSIYKTKIHFFYSIKLHNSILHSKKTLQIIQIDEAVSRRPALPAALCTMCTSARLLRCWLAPINAPPPPHIITRTPWLNVFACALQAH